MIALKKNTGFTLVELLVALTVSAAVMTAVYSSYHSQQKSYGVQEEMAAMQQNLRAAMYYMSSQIREAGCNPSSSKSIHPGIVTAEASRIRFTADVGGNGFGSDPDGDILDDFEDVTYALYTTDGVQRLGVRRTAGAVPQRVIDNVEALNFVYLDGAGNVTAVRANIRSVEISIVVRAAREDQDYVNTDVYKNQRGDTLVTGPGDHFRRRMLTMRVACRNLGL